MLCIPIPLQFLRRVVPEIASRSHVQKIGAVVTGALEQANLTLEQLDAVAVTNGPGLVGALMVGLSYAKGWLRRRASVSWRAPYCGAHCRELSDLSRIGTAVYLPDRLRRA